MKLGVDFFSTLFLFISRHATNNFHHPPADALFKKLDLINSTIMSSSQLSEKRNAAREVIDILQEISILLVR